MLNRPNTEELAEMRTQVFAKIEELYPKETNRGRWREMPLYKLARLRRNTGFRGVTWFFKGDIILGWKRADGTVETYSWHPWFTHGDKTSFVGACILPNDNALAWLETPVMPPAKPAPPSDPLDNYVG